MEKQIKTDWDYIKSIIKDKKSIEKVDSIIKNLIREEKLKIILNL